MYNIGRLATFGQYAYDTEWSCRIILQTRDFIVIYNITAREHLTK